MSLRFESMADMPEGMRSLYTKKVLPEVRTAKGTPGTAFHTRDTQNGGELRHMQL